MYFFFLEMYAAISIHLSAIHNISIIEVDHMSSNFIW